MNAKDDKSELPNPTTLVEAVKVFSNEDTALRFMVALRWGGFDTRLLPAADRCVRFIQTRRVWECREDHKGKRFSLKTNTVMEESPLPLSTWLIAIWLEANAKNSISSYEVMRSLGVTQKTGWFMQQRIRLAMQNGSLEKLSGDIEADETFMGGLSKNMHSKTRKAKILGGGAIGKTAVMAILKRGGEVRTAVVPNVKGETLQAEVIKHVKEGSNLYTDSCLGYRAAFMGLCPPVR